MPTELDSTINHLKELFDERLKPLITGISELRTEIKEINSTGLTLRVDALERSKEHYKLQYTETVKKVDILEQRLNKLETISDDVKQLDDIKLSLDRLVNKMEELETTLDKHDTLEVGNNTTLQQDLNKLKKDLSLYLMATEYPKLTIFILISLFTLSQSDKILNILQHLFILFK